MGSFYFALVFGALLLVALAIVVVRMLTDKAAPVWIVVGLIVVTAVGLGFIPKAELCDLLGGRMSDNGRVCIGESFGSD